MFSLGFTIIEEPWSRRFCPANSQCTNLRGIHGSFWSPLAFNENYGAEVESSYFSCKSKACINISNMQLKKSESFFSTLPSGFVHVVNPFGHTWRSPFWSCGLDLAGPVNCLASLILWFPWTHHPSHNNQNFLNAWGMVGCCWCEVARVLNPISTEICVLQMPGVASQPIWYFKLVSPFWKVFIGLSLSEVTFFIAVFLVFNGLFNGFTQSVMQPLLVIHCFYFDCQWEPIWLSMFSRRGKKDSTHP